VKRSRELGILRLDSRLKVSVNKLIKNICTYQPGIKTPYLDSLGLLDKTNVYILAELKLKENLEKQNTAITYVIDNG
jgi:hypothetical protein